MTDAACAVLGCMNKEEVWLAENRK